MQSLSFVRKLGMFTVLAAISTFSAKAQEIKTVFVIAMENHNWTQPANQFTGARELERKFFDQFAAAL